MTDQHRNMGKVYVRISGNQYLLKIGEYLSHLVILKILLMLIMIAIMGPCRIILIALTIHLPLIFLSQGN